MKYQVIFKSQSGNTEMVARAIMQTLPQNDAQLVNMATQQPTMDAEIYFVGFGVYHGTCPLEVLELLEMLEGKKILLFGTCGIEPTEKYCSHIERTIETFMPDNCDYLGMYLCQGAMAPSAKDAIVQMNKQIKEDVRIRAVEQAYQQSQSHPDAIDLENASRFAENVLNITD